MLLIMICSQYNHADQCMTLIGNLTGRALQSLIRSENVVCFLWSIARQPALCTKCSRAMIDGLLAAPVSKNVIYRKKDDHRSAKVQVHVLLVSARSNQKRSSVHELAHSSGAPCCMLLQCTAQVSIVV